MLKACAGCGRPIPKNWNRCVRCGGGLTDDQRRHALAKKHGTSTGHWKRLRQLALARDNHECTLRHARCTGVATTVHIDPRLGGNHLLATLADCRSACRRCHGKEDAPRASRR